MLEILAIQLIEMAWESKQWLLVFGGIGLLVLDIVTDCIGLPT